MQPAQGHASLGASKVRVLFTSVPRCPWQFVPVPELSGLGPNAQPQLQPTQKVGSDSCLPATPRALWLLPAPTLLLSHLSNRLPEDRGPWCRRERAGQDTQAPASAFFPRDRLQHSRTCPGWILIFASDPLGFKSSFGFLLRFRALFPETTSGHAALRWVRKRHRPPSVPERAGPASAPSWRTPGHALSAAP